jgi:tRNA-uridine 2-sulfurtransferase
MTNRKKIIIGLSGGVDSAVAAHIYVEMGYEVIGVTLKMKSCEDNKEKTKACCGLDDNLQARMVAEKLGIRHYFLDVRPTFKKRILDYAWQEYSLAKTPNPCVWCNHYLKFGALLDFAKELDAIGVITGHYAILKRDQNGNVKMFKGVDNNKNQTYFLSALTQYQLNHSYMPLGELKKTKVREIADKLELPNAKKTESQDACFGYKGETFAQTLARINDSVLKPGNLINDNNEVIGQHNGIQNFTIGQRKGLGVALGKPAYVTDINAKNNTVHISTDMDKLLCNKFTADNMNWLEFDYDKLECEVQTRYRQKPTKAIVHRKGDSTAEIEFLNPVRAVTPGQAVAIYNNDQFIAGGWIDQILE